MLQQSCPPTVLILEGTGLRIGARVHWTSSPLLGAGHGQASHQIPESHHSYKSHSSSHALACGTLERVRLTYSGIVSAIGLTLSALGPLLTLCVLATATEADDEPPKRVRLAILRYSPGRVVSVSRNIDRRFTSSQVHIQYLACSLNGSQS
jgi:hypothetical protein